MEKTQGAKDKLGRQETGIQESRSRWTEGEEDNRGNEQNAGERGESSQDTKKIRQ